MSDLIKEASSAFSLGMKGGDAPVDKARKDMDPAGTLLSNLRS